ncbi:Anaphase-promoting complex subunit 8 [Astathelohania contejeani]|uniref:Anaphase-promoting complex subunit 8 n=1 Tax=Astathelohania contejeani TaxID=164912 RepID=A0ABQ7I0S7_9MICR|nr:Anaphase-promoting complex subunit 8 [Thelohania contejeani]
MAITLMLENFINRCLYKSIDFISKVGIKYESVKLVQPFPLYEAITRFNLKEYRHVYHILLCSQSQIHLGSVVFCDCCSPTQNFLRNYALIIHFSTIKLPTEHFHKPTHDPFLLYLRALITPKKDKKIKLLIQCLNTNEYIWEAYEHLAEQIDYSNIEKIETKLAIKDDLKSIFFLYVFCQRMCKTSNFYLYFDQVLQIEGGNSLSSIGYNPSTEKWNDQPVCSIGSNSNFIGSLIASTLYHIKQFERSKAIFENIIQNKFYFNLDYIDLYSNILYIKNDAIALAELAMSVAAIDKFKPETHAVIANYYSLRGDHEKAIEYFEKSIMLDSRFTTTSTLIGHEYVDLKNINGAIQAYNRSIRYNQSDYRAWFGMAQVYNTLKLYEYSLFYYNKALELNNQDAFIWSSVGKLLCHSKKYEDALQCFKCVVDLGDHEGYLLIADLYKNEKKYVASVKYYEKYVYEIISAGKEITESINNIFSFLSEYFNKVGNKKKSDYYARLSGNERFDK